MASRLVEYIIGLRDQFSSVAAKVSAEAQKSAAALSKMGAAANTAERSLNAIKGSPGLSAVAKQADAASASLNRMAAAEATQAKAREAYANKASIGIAKMRAEREAAEKASSAAAGKGGRFGLFDAWAAWSMGSAALHGADKLVGRAGSIDTMLEKLRYSTGGDEAAVREAYEKAFSMSGKYKNTTVLENLHMIDDLRANLPESMHHILGESLEPFVRLHGFFKSYDGGKHKGAAESALKDIGIAIRSGELMGNLSGEDLARHAQAIATSRIVFGEKFKLNEYFTAQKAASTAINAADDTFKHVDFPALVQSLGQRAGTGLATLYNKTVGGIMVRGASAEAWRALGLVNMDQVSLNKAGLIDPKSIVGKKWLKGDPGTNMLEWMMGTVVPAIGRGAVKGLDGGAFKDAWKAGDVEKLVKLTKDIDRNSLSRVLAGLGYDRTAIMEMEEMILRAAAIARDRAQFAKSLKDIENYSSYEKSKQAFSAQVDRLFQALTGREFIPWVKKTVDDLSSSVGDLAAKVDQNPLLGRVINAAGMSTAALLAGRLLSTLTGIRALGPIGAALGVGAAVYSNWDQLSATWEKLKAAFAEPLKIDVIFPELPDWLKSFIAQGHEANRDIQRKMDDRYDWSDDNVTANYSHALRSGGGMFPKVWGPGSNPVEGGGYMQWMTGEMQRMRGAGESGRFASPGLADSVAAREISIKSDVAVTGEAKVNVTISGTVNGPVTGSADATAPLSQSTSRGQTGVVTVPGPKVD